MELIFFSETPREEFIKQYGAKMSDAVCNAYYDMRVSFEDYVAADARRRTISNAIDFEKRFTKKDIAKIDKLEKECNQVNTIAHIRFTNYQKKRTAFINHMKKEGKNIREFVDEHLLPIPPKYLCDRWIHPEIDIQFDEDID